MPAAIQGHAGCYLDPAFPAVRVRVLVDLQTAQHAPPMKQAVVRPHMAKHVVRIRRKVAGGHELAGKEAVPLGGDVVARLTWRLVSWLRLPFIMLLIVLPRVHHSGYSSLPR